MRIRKIDFPIEILEAQRKGHLVIFAGAGVSMGPPSDYPNFDGLAREVASGTDFPRTSGEDVDRYLGRLQAVGVRVHERVRSRLSSRDSKPNSLHQGLVAIFNDPQELRIVTTNFDTHFTTVVRQVFTEEIPEVFSAPALPLGSDFSGIVHIHGSVEKSAHTLVLTDTDFGRAYITEGFATRFLERLFNRYVVLFVGYSHQDVLLTYLARGVTAGSSGPGRFAFTLPGEDARWENLGIKPIHYPAGTEQRHLELQKAIAAWAEQSRAGALAVEERIRAIVSAGVPLDPEDLDYLQHSIKELSTTRLFTRYATDPAWLNWIEGQVAFQTIFQLRTDYSDVDEELANWFATNFVCSHSDVALDLVRRKCPDLSLLLWRAVAFAIFRKKPHGTVLSKWVTVLLSSTFRTANAQVLEYILCACKFPEDSDSALMLLEYLTKPIVKLDTSLNLSDEPQERIRAKVECVGSDHWLTEAWSKLFRINLEKFAGPLTALVSYHLTLTHHLLSSYTKEYWDTISFSRGMIESREQDHIHGGLSVLLDIGAGVIKWFSEKDPAMCGGVVEEWSRSESLILRRLALYGISLATHLAAEEKLARVVETRILFTPGIKHEVFLIMASAYPGASSEARQRFIRSVLDWTDEKVESDPEYREIRKYEKFNVLIWLKRHAPDCPFVVAAIKEIKESRGDYGEREHPDLDHWIGSVTSGGWSETEGITDLTSLNLESLRAKIREAPETSYPGITDSKQQLLQSVGECARKYFDWGLKIANECVAANDWSIEIWEQLLSAWLTLSLTAEQWDATLPILLNASAIHPALIRSLSSLIEMGIQKTPPLPATSLSRAKALADALVNIAADVESGSSGSAHLDWLFKAINHPMGQLVEFYLHALSRYRADKLLDDSILSDYLTTCSQIVNGIQSGYELGRVILAGQAHFLFGLDEAWTVREIFPLLDPLIDRERALHCWQGFVHSGRWSDSLHHLLPLYERMFPMITNTDDEMRRYFCGHLAGIAAFAEIDPLTSGWLFRFLKAVSPDVRALWAEQIHRVLQRLDENAKKNLWDRWLERYWKERLDGIPIGLEAVEITAMLQWLLDLGPATPAAVSFFCAGPCPNYGEHGMMYYSINKSPLLLTYPNHFVDLLTFLATNESTERTIYDLNELADAVEKLVDAVPGHPKLRSLCDELVRLGVPDIAALVRKLKFGDSLGL